MHGVLVKIDDGLLLRLGPKTLAVEETGESHLRLERYPREGKDETNDRNERIGQWPQAPR
jgi:hypothetical protein